MTKPFTVDFADLEHRIMAHAAADDGTRLRGVLDFHGTVTGRLPPPAVPAALRTAITHHRSIVHRLQKELGLLAMMQADGDLSESMSRIADDINVSLGELMTAYNQARKSL